MSLDISGSVEPRSDQLNYDDVAANDLTITITDVKQGPPDQPVHLHNAEFPGRPYKPGKSMRRVLIAAWGTDAAQYVGKRIQLFGDPTIRFGKEAVGGIRIRALSHIPGPLDVKLTVTRGKRENFTVTPLLTVNEVAAWLTEASTMDALKTAWVRVTQAGFGQQLDALKEERKAAISAADS